MCRELIKNEESLDDTECNEICLEENNKEAIKEKIRQTTESANL
jgi:hypothetical protein